MLKQIRPVILLVADMWQINGSILP